MKSYWVYMLRCRDESFYTGVTSNIEVREYQHNNGVCGRKAYTYNRRPVTLVFAALYYDIEQAIRFEKQLKGWSRAKKEAIARGDYSELKRLAISYVTLRQAQGDTGTR